MSGKTILFSSSIGDITFPITPTSIDGMAIGQGTPAPGTFTALEAAGGAIPLAIADTIAAGLTSAPTAVVDRITSVTTADGTHIAVILPTGVAGDERLIYNTAGGTSETISVYPQSTDMIDGGGAGVHTTLTAAHRGAWFYCIAANTWISALIGAVTS